MSIAGFSKKIYTSLAPVSYPVVKIKIYPSEENEKQNEPFWITFDQKDKNQAPQWLTEFSVEKIGPDHYRNGTAGSTFTFRIDVPSSLMADYLLIMGWNKIEINYGMSKDDPLYKVTHRCYAKEYSVNFTPYGCSINITAQCTGFVYGDAAMIKQNDSFKGRDLLEVLTKITMKYKNIKLGIIDKNLSFKKNKRIKKGKDYILSAGNKEAKLFPMSLYDFLNTELLTNLNYEKKDAKQAKIEIVFLIKEDEQELFNEISSNMYNEISLDEKSKNYFENDYRTDYEIQNDIKNATNDDLFINILSSKSIEQKIVKPKARFVFNASDVHAESKKNGYLNRIISWNPVQNSQVRKISGEGASTIIKQILDDKGLIISNLNVSKNGNITDKAIQIPINENDKDSSELQMKFLLETMAKLEFKANMEVVGCSGLNLGDTIEILVFDNYNKLLYSSGLYFILTVKDSIKNGLFITELELIKKSSYTGTLSNMKEKIEENKLKAKEENITKKFSK